MGSTSWSRLVNRFFPVAMPDKARPGLADHSCILLHPRFPVWRCRQTSPRVKRSCGRRGSCETCRSGILIRRGAHLPFIGRKSISARRTGGTIVSYSSSVERNERTKQVTPNTETFNRVGSGCSQCPGCTPTGTHRSGAGSYRPCEA